MIIDFHTHFYPDTIASEVIKKLSASASVKAFTNATENGLEQSCIENNIDYSIVLPVATNYRQTETINRVAAEINRKKGHLVSFGGIHPDNTDYKRIINSLVAEGIPGIKLHPIFQKTNLDDIRYLRIIDCACEHGLIISVHAGLDVSDSDAFYSSVPHTMNMLKAVTPDKMILAHMGGHLCWDEAENMLLEYIAEKPAGKSIYLDTAFCLPSKDPAQNTDHALMNNEQFVRMVRLVGPEHVLFGTDSPWTHQGASISSIKNSGLTEKETSLIFYENARNLLTY